MYRIERLLRKKIISSTQEYLGARFKVEIAPVAKMGKFLLRNLQELITDRIVRERAKQCYMPACIVNHLTTNQENSLTLAIEVLQKRRLRSLTGQGLGFLALFRRTVAVRDTEDLYA